MKLFSLKPYDYSDDNTPDDSPWKDENHTGQGHFLAYGMNELEARESISKHDNGKALDLINSRNKSAFMAVCEDHLGATFDYGAICPFMDRKYTKCVEMKPSSDGVFDGEIYIGDT